jgi:hypothetical protein
MIDSIKISFKDFHPHPDQVELWQKSSQSSGKGWVMHQRAHQVELNNGAKVLLHYYPVGYNLHLEFSLPNLLFGNNIQEVTDIQESIRIAQEIFDAHPELPEVDLREGKIIRLDVCWNHETMAHTPDYINAIAGLTYPNRTKVVFPGESVIFKSQRSRTMFYDKYNQTDGNPNAKGLLRQESSFRHGLAVEKALNIYKPRLGELTKAKLIDILRRDLELTGIDQVTLNSDMASVYKLADEFGPYGGPYYWALLKLGGTYHRRTTADALDRHPSTIDGRVRKAVKKAGYAPTLVTGSSPLPSLTIDPASKGIQLEEELEPINH